MALVRVYCGLASVDSADRPASAGSTLTSAVVDDAGRLLHVCEIDDDPAGYARLVVLLVERSGGPSGAAIAADSDDHTVTSLLSAAGRPLAIADDDSVDDFAERFADDDSVEEMQSPPVERRAVGLARALQAGALSAVTLPPPRDLAGYKQVLSAHAALASGRHSAAAALREVLRELYPAALRAYPDPAEPVALAVLDALPEPGMLGGTIARGREVSVAADAIAAHLAADGVADADEINDAVTALRVAISETPRRAAVSRALTSAVAETVRQAVASVRACDAGCEALVSALGARVTAPASAAGRRATSHRGEPVAELTGLAGVGTGLRALRPTEPEPVGRRSRPEPVPGSSLPAMPRPLGPPPVAPEPIAPPPVAPRPVVPAATASPASPAVSALPTTGEPRRVDGPTNRPVPPPPPGITPMAPLQRERGSVPPAEAGEPFRPTLTTAAIQHARTERQRTVIPPRPKTTGESAPPIGGFSATDLSVPVPTPRPSQDSAPPGSRANWPLVNNPEDLSDSAADNPVVRAFDDRGQRQIDGPTALVPTEGRVTPPWLADDLPQEPPMLRLVEPPPLADRALRHGPAPTGDAHLETPPLRLVDRGESSRADRPAPQPHPERPAMERLPERPVTEHRLDRPAMERLPERPAMERLPERPVTEHRLDRPAMERLPERPVTERLPERPAMEHRLDRPVTERLPERPVTERLPERPAMEHRLDRPVTERLPERPVTERLPERPAMEHRLDRPAMERLPERPVTERLPERPAMEHRLDRPVTERLPERPVTERRPAPVQSPRAAPMERRTPPISAEDDGDLLIFAAARSAWFVGQDDESELDWASTADTGWQAAEQAARPAVGAETKAGLPKRVPQANLVPGSPLREERPLRIVRNAASLAENTTGYFRGWRRGQEIGGFAVGGRPGREAAGGWDFTRDTGDRDDDREFEYRSAGYRS